MNRTFHFSRNLVVLLSLGLLSSLGCPSKDVQTDGGGAMIAMIDAGTIDAGTIDAGAIDAGAIAKTDAGLVPIDSGRPVDESNGDGGPSQSISRADAGAPTVDPGAGGSNDPIDLGPVQCREASDCPDALGCNRDAPGGICSCASSCPTGTQCSQFGVCVRSCATDTDCNAGWSCLSSGHCGLRNCADDASCAGGYICRSDGRCARPACGMNDACPSSLACLAGLCVER